MGQHTQGPWIVSLDPRYPNEPCIDAVIDGVTWHIALCHNAAGPDDGSAEANARLIAAAPELYEALQALLENDAINLWVGGNPNVINEVVARGLAALQKAEGR